MKSQQDLKQLKRRYQEATAAGDAAKEDIKIAQQRESEINKLKASLKKQIEVLELNFKEPLITDHAICRYFERVLGFDLDKIKDEILPEATKRTIMKMGAGKYPTGKGHRLVVKDNAVVTVEPA